MALIKPRQAQRSIVDQNCESIAVTELIIGKWYDPISERWIVPRETRAMAGYGRPGAEKAPEPHEKREAQRIWDLLVDCCVGE